MVMLMDKEQKQTSNIPLREKFAIEAVIRRAKREHRTMSSALAVIVYEWIVLKTQAKDRLAAARQSQPLPGSRQDTAENLAAALNAAAVGTEQPK
jgi:hypothetical protein